MVWGDLPSIFEPSFCAEGFDRNPVFVAGFCVCRMFLNQRNVTGFLVGGLAQHPFFDIAIRFNADLNPAGI
jgi:hypothetical protein